MKQEPLTAYERMKLALFMISQLKGKALLGNGRYDEGANAAFEQAAEIAEDALTAVDELGKGLTMHTEHAVKMANRWKQLNQMKIQLIDMVAELGDVMRDIEKELAEERAKEEAGHDV